MLHPHKILSRQWRDEQRIRVLIGKIAQTMKIDSKVSLGLTSEMKETIRREARLKRTKMSPMIREKLGLEEGTVRKKKP